MRESAPYIDVLINIYRCNYKILIMYSYTRDGLSDQRADPLLF